MGTNSKIDLNNDPYKDVKMTMEGLYISQGSPMLLQSSHSNRFELSSPSNMEFRLAVVSGEALVSVSPDSSTWVKVGGFGNFAKWLITPGSQEGSPELILFSRHAEKVLEFNCEFFNSARPLYSSTTFLVGGPFVWGYVTHKAVIPLPRTQYKSRLSILAQSRIGEKVKLEFTGVDGVPDVTSINPQPVVDGGVGWDFSFEKLGEVKPVTAWVEFENGLKTYLDYVPTDRIEPVSSELEQSGVIDSLRDSAKE